MTCLVSKACTQAEKFNGEPQKKIIGAKQKQNQTKKNIYIAETMDSDKFGSIVTYLILEKHVLNLGNQMLT